MLILQQICASTTMQLDKQMGHQKALLLLACRIGVQLKQKVVKSLFWNPEILN